MEVIAFTMVNLPFGWCSNMSPYPVVVDDDWAVGSRRFGYGKGPVEFRTAEALFQSLRFDDWAIWEEIREQKSPMGAKMVAKRYLDRAIVVPRSSRDLENMARVVSLKIQQHPELKTGLLNTGETQIIEDCTNRPSESGLFWGAVLRGDGTWEGRNELGKIWMDLRGVLG